MEDSSALSGLGELVKVLWDGITSGSTEEFYDRFSAAYDHFFSVQKTYAADTAAILMDYLGERNLPAERVLEAGCGTGVYTAELEKLCGSLFGLDFSEGQLSQARTKGLSAALTRGDVTALPYSGESFDIVTSLGMLRHLPGKMMEQYFSEAHRVLRPGGVLFSEPMPSDWHTLSNPPFGRLLKRAYNAFMAWRGLDEHLSEDRAADIEGAMLAAGFLVERVTARKSHAYDVVVGRKPL